MHIATSFPELQLALGRFSTAPVLVPTMGNLHAGHLALVARARRSGAPVVASIFVNRLQFLPHEDFDRYPRTFEADCAALREADCDILFAPDEAELYPEPQVFRVQPDPALADILEGEFRPGFFTGVCTVVLKLFACMQPRAAVFGRKDWQQLTVVRHMVRQFGWPIEILEHDTVREADGLALSSRNAYLGTAERHEAPQLHAALRAMAARARHLSGVAGAAMASDAWAALEAEACERLQARGWQPDYLTVRRRTDLQPPRRAGEALVVLGAARLGGTRLIDNVEV